MWRWRRRIGRSEWQFLEVDWIVERHLAGLGVLQALAWLRGHWEVENRIFWARGEIRGKKSPVSDIDRRAQCPLLWKKRICYRSFFALMVRSRQKGDGNGEKDKS
ncbi:MAG: hypothetical protein NZ765_11405 [Anaerolineae bacterium]|nr:hypothetical protein [Anaerolineae bacterium]MDW8072202.1 hypothetical protein [Anaerolineae bacterium]